MELLLVCASAEPGRWQTERCHKVLGKQSNASALPRPRQRGPARWAAQGSPRVSGSLQIAAPHGEQRVESSDCAYAYGQYKICAGKAEVVTVPAFLNGLFKQDESRAAEPPAASLGRSSRDAQQHPSHSAPPCIFPLECPTYDSSTCYKHDCFLPIFTSILSSY